MVRYAYGDWQYYALAKTGLLRGIAALFWPTQAGLGRRLLPGPVSVENVRARVREGVEEIYLFEVEAALIERLRKDLDAIYHENLGSLVYNSIYDLEFVHHPKSYWMFHNSNHVMGDWLERLGCELHGPALFSDWKVVPEAR